MSKELLDNVYTIKNAITYLKGNSYIKEDSYSMEALYHIEKALTPPTAEEVCKALSEYDDFDEVNYRVSTRGFYSNDTICYLGIDYQEKPIIIFEYDLPPHLIRLIGRFYEGEIK